MSDLELISGEFLEARLDKSKEYLLKYFKEEHQVVFLVYCFHFPALFKRSGKFFHRNFIDHTGLNYTLRIIQKWSKRLRDLEKALEKAYAESDLMLISKIKNGDYKVNKRYGKKALKYQESQSRRNGGNT